MSDRWIAGFTGCVQGATDDKRKNNAASNVS
jgi:hypothetical protein